ncbi:unnamed protein product [Candidula unifasciata]|uniref:Conodipine-M alpha chain n=1 Tax=Candidula unifasciata TaxID=100452 RepID=A0A8S3YKK3_9EUPU|nr:unnamed protein product [Candidula unifasciata]
MAAFLTTVILHNVLIAVSTSASDSPANGTDICYRYDVSGCSIPFGLNFFYKKRFTPSCNRHDICYSCAVAYNMTRATCDRAFRHDTTTACRNDFLHSSFDKENPRPREHIQKLQRQTDVLAILDKFAGKFKPIFWEVIASHNMLCNKMDKYECAHEFIQLYTDKVVTKWAGMLARYLQVNDNMVQKSSLLQHFLPSIRKEHAASISGSEINTDLKHERHDKFVFRQAKEKVILPRQKSPEGAFLESNSNDNEFCKKIQRNVLSSGSFNKLTVELKCTEIKLIQCMFFSEVYYMAVHLFGSSRFSYQSEFYCNESFVPQCLPPH